MDDMTEDNRRPDEPQQPDSSSDEPTRPLPPYGAAGGASAASDPAGATEDTTRFRRSEEQAPIWQGTPYLPPSEATTRRRGGKGFVAAVLAGALVLGGAAGFGGAAAYDAVRGDDAPATDRAARDYEATSTSVIEEGTVEGVAEAVLPSVVKVNVVGASSGGPMGESASGSGSGIVLSEDGQILTNNHVVEAAEDGGAISVSFSDGSSAQAEIVGTDPLVDIAVIQAEGVSDLTPASIGQSGDLDVGQAVVAIGSPFGLDATVTTGIVSALNRPVTVESEEEQQSPFEEPSQTAQSTTYPAIQTDAAINPGNSGGPLVDMSGRVVGINSSIRSTASASGQAGSIGLGFSIPMDEVLPIVNQIVAGETPTHARLGISVSDPDPSAEGPTTGAVVAAVEPEGAAALAGLEEGDVVTQVDGQMIDSADSLVATIRGHRPGDEVTVTYLRDGEEQTIDTELGSDAGQPTS